MNEILIKAIRKAITSQIQLAKLQRNKDNERQQYFDGVIDALNYVNEIIE